jgi:GrpB-like predicted nucleotidyltransferase (UPF0157 family)
MIEIISYQNRWPEEFKVIGAKIRNAVGDKAIAIHHIGSTSVPNLAAKDVIDIQMSVASLDVQIQSQLQAIGFELGPHTQDHCPLGLQLPSSELEKRYYQGTNPKINLHIRKQGAFNQVYPILFRDFLRSNSLATEAYGEIKRQLAKYFPDNVDAYYDIKDPVCDALMAGAFEWSKANQWQQGITEA